MESFKDILTDLLSKLNISGDVFEMESNFLTKVSTIFNTATQNIFQPFADDSTLMTTLILPIGVIIAAIYWCLSLLDKVESEKFTTEILIKSFIRFVLGVMIITNSFAIVKQFDKFTVNIIQDITNLSIDTQTGIEEESASSALDKLYAKGARNYSRLSNDDEIPEDEEGTGEGEGTTEETPPSTPATPPAMTGSYPESECRTPGFNNTGYFKNGDCLPNVDVTVSYLKEQGYSSAAIAGILGNMMVEGGFNPQIREGGTEGSYIINKGYGIVQLTTGASSSYISYGDTIDSQLEYVFKPGGMVYRLNNSECAYSLDDFKLFTDPVAACEVFAIEFERPGHTYSPGIATTPEGQQATATMGRNQYINHLEERIGYTKYFANNLGAFGGISSTSPFLKDIFSNSMSADEATASVAEIVFIWLSSSIITLCLYAVAYSRAIKMAYLLLFCPMAIGQSFIKNGVTERIVSYFKQVLATALTFPVIYIICLFYFMIIDSVLNQASDSTGGMGVLGVLLMSVVAVIATVKSANNETEQILS